jgi:hypothetical protein
MPMKQIANVATVTAVAIAVRESVIMAVSKGKRERPLI